MYLNHDTAQTTGHRELSLYVYTQVKVFIVNMHLNQHFSHSQAVVLGSCRSFIGDTKWDQLRGSYKNLFNYQCDSIIIDWENMTISMVKFLVHRIPDDYNCECKFYLIQIIAQNGLSVKIRFHSSVCLNSQTDNSPFFSAVSYF